MDRKIYREYDKEGNLIKKECSKCHVIKGVSCFCKATRYKDGIYTICKECVRKYQLENKERIKEVTQQYRIDNKDKIKYQRHQHYLENREKILDLERDYNRKNKDKVSKRRKQYRINRINKEMNEIYENFTKIKYPNKGIQYGVIYGVHNIITDRWYIGQTIQGFKNRYKNNFFKYCLKDTGKNNMNKKIFDDDLKHYGKESFEFIEVIDVGFSKDDLDKKEGYYINYYKSKTEGYNTQKGNSKKSFEYFYNNKTYIITIQDKEE